MTHPDFVALPPPLLQDQAYDCVDAQGRTSVYIDVLDGIPFAQGSQVPDGCTPKASIAAQAVDGALGPGAFREAVAGFNKSMATFWVDTKSPTLVDAQNVANGPVAAIQNSLWFYTLIVMIIGIAIKGAMIAWQGRGTELNVMMANLIRFVLVSSMGAAVVTIALIAGDEFAAWIIDKSATGGFADQINALMTSDNALAGFGVVAQYIVLGVAALASLLQLIILYFRAAALFPVVGAWPFSAACASFRMGQASYEGVTGWIIALVLYKPVAAIVYAAGFWLIGDTTPGQDTTFWGIALIVLSVVALPAIVKIINPSTSAAGGAGFGQLSATGAAMFAAGRR